MKDAMDSSISGVTTGDFGGISPVFTDVYLISEGDINILAKGKRYGRWWLLKGLQPEASCRQRAWRTCPDWASAL